MTGLGLPRFYGRASIVKHDIDIARAAMNSRRPILIFRATSIAA